MTEEENLLLSWKNSLREEDVISNDYSIDGEEVTLTVTRCVNKNDIGKSLFTKCPLHVDDINKAIEDLSNQRDRLIF